MNITLVPVAHVDQIWPQVAQGLHDACVKTGGDMTGGELWQQCRNGSAFLIIAHDGPEIFAASVWRPETWASGGRLRCLALYGRSLWAWIRPMREVVVRLRDECGCVALVAEGLDKWDALFRRLFPKAMRLRTLYEEMR